MSEGGREGGGREGGGRERREEGRRRERRKEGGRGGGRREGEEGGRREREGEEGGRREREGEEGGSAQEMEYIRLCNLNSDVYYSIISPISNIIETLGLFFINRFLCCCFFFKFHLIYHLGCWLGHSVVCLLIWLPH